MRADLQILAERVRQCQRQMLEEEGAYVDVSRVSVSSCQSVCSSYSVLGQIRLLKLFKLPHCSTFRLQTSFWTQLPMN